MIGWRRETSTSTTLLRVLIFALAAAILVGPALAGDKPSIAVFDFELQDASHEGARDGVRPDQTQRLDRVSAELRRLMTDSGKFDVVSVAPMAARIESEGPIQYCNGCDGDIARDLGADYALAGFVYKVSNLILEIHIYLRDIETGLLKAKMVSSIRGNTDESWLRGVRWMFENRLTKLDIPAK